MSTFAFRLRELRKSRKFTQSGLAARVGITDAVLSNYERDQREPDFNTLICLAKALCVSTDYLLGYSDDECPNAKEFVEITGLSESTLAGFCYLPEASAITNALFTSSNVREIHHQCFLLINMIERICNSEKNNYITQGTPFPPDNADYVCVSPAEYFSYRAQMVGNEIAAALKNWSMSEAGINPHEDDVSTEFSF